MPTYPKGLVIQKINFEPEAPRRTREKTSGTQGMQNNAGSRVSNTEYWENLVLVVVLVS